MESLRLNHASDSRLVDLVDLVGIGVVADLHRMPKVHLVLPVVGSLRVKMAVVEDIVVLLELGEFSLRNSMCRSTLVR